MAEEEKNKKKKVAFPHMGTIHIAWAAALRKVGVEPFEPPYTNKKTLTLGTKNSPEAICLPYKLILGNFIEALEGGTDYVAMISSPGICRLGEYGSSIKNALKDMGYEANYIELALYDGIKGLFTFLTELTGGNHPIMFTKAIVGMIRAVFLLDDMEKLLFYYSAREVTPGDAEKRYKKGLKYIKDARTQKDLKEAKKKAFAE